MDNFIRVPRIADIPYGSSPPVQFSFSSTANLDLGRYTWNDQPSAFSPQRPILSNALYYFRSLTLSADIAEIDFTSNLVTPPSFYCFLKGDAKAPLYREPFQMDRFYSQFEFPFFWRRHSQDDILYGAFKGVLTQGTELIGKTSITLRVVISATEITHEGYVSDFVNRPYPEAGRKLQGA